MVTTVFGQAFPEKTMGVTDNANLLSAAQEQQINAVLADLDRQKGIEFHVVTLSLVGNYMKDATVDQYAELLFVKWRIPADTSLGGVLLLVSQHDRALRIELSRSLGHKHDAALKDIVDRVMVPAFRNDNYGAGIQQGVDHIIREITGVSSDRSDNNQLTRWWTDLKTWLGGFIFIGLAPIGFLVYRAYRAAKRRAPRRCPVDGSWMPRFLDEFEHKHLTAGQLKEKELASKEYDVWICRECDHVKVEGFNRKFSSYEVCKTCNFKALVTLNSEISLRPTFMSSGRLRTTCRCKNCDETYPIYTVIPSRASSAVSSSLRGGGRSGRGGASGRW